MVRAAFYRIKCEVRSWEKLSEVSEMVFVTCSQTDKAVEALTTFHNAAIALCPATAPAELERTFRGQKLFLLKRTLYQIEDWSCKYRERDRDGSLAPLRRITRIERVLSKEPCFYNTQISLSEDQILNIAKEAGTEVADVLQFISHMYTAGYLDFPWKRYFLQDPREMFRELQNYQAVVNNQQPRNTRPRSWKTNNFLPYDNFEGVPTTIMVTIHDYEIMDVIVDYFQEKCRLSARRSDQPKPPLELWKENDQVFKVLQNALKERNAISTYAVRETLYKVIKECTQFKPSFVVAVGKIVGGTRVLDFSAGWGDRLAGFLALGVQRYVGFDPNIKLREGHDAIQKTLVPCQAVPTNVTIDYSPFEDGVLPPGETFDLVFTSPPFFDFEEYEGKNTSTTRYPEVGRWAVEFLFLALHKAWSVLDDNGHLCIYIEDSRGVTITEAMCLFILAALPGSETRGVIFSFATGSSERYRPLWVFKKAPLADPKRREEALEYLKLYYADLYRKLTEHSILAGMVTRNFEDDRLTKRTKS